MIAKMIRVTFVGLQNDREGFIKRLQELGLTHLIIPGEALEPTETAKALEKVIDARKFLLRRLKKGEEEKGALEDAGEICSRLEALKDRETRLQADLTALKKELARSLVWGEVDSQDVALLRSNGVDVRFFRMTRKEFERLPEGEAFIQVTWQSEGEVAFMAVSSNPLSFAQAAEKDPQSPARLTAQIQSAEAELEQIRKEQSELARRVPAL
ncbi:MAG: hypothetical protein V1742_00660, partial [Pseudomonadota bacterium]